VVRWRFGFPVKLSADALFDRNYYHFVLDGIRHLCNKANVYPCVLDAAKSRYPLPSEKKSVVIFAGYWQLRFPKRIWN